MDFLHILLWELINLLTLKSCIDASQYDPHVFPRHGPFFEGWYLRFVDFDDRTSTGLLFGHVFPKSTAQSKDSILVLASLLHRTNCTDGSCILESVNAVSESKYLNVTVKGGPVIQDPDYISPSHFKWQAPFGSFIQDGNVTKFRFIFGKFEFSGLIGTPVYWGPNGEGPEGWIDKLPFLPLHWFVFSLRSPVIWYKLTNTESGQTKNVTNGVVHMEKNWGDSFPEGWIWSQGVTSQNVSYALSGGLVAVAHITSVQYLIGYRNPQKGLDLNFRPGTSIVTTTHDGCTGTFKLAVKSLLYEVHINVAAAPKTFSGCLYGPEETGFRPVCTESYDAFATIIVFKREYFQLKQIDAQNLTNSALEFGGQYTCNRKCDSI